MENLKLNETPVRTSRNFNINNIKLDNIKIPKQIPEFKNITITSDISKTKIEKKTSKINLVYGLNDYLTNQVNTQKNNEIKITIDDKENKKTQIDFKLDTKNCVLIDNIEIIANKNTKSTVIIKYISEEEIKAYHNGIIRVDAKENSNIDIILVNFMNTKSNNFIAIENTLGENSKVNYYIIDFGGKNSITNYYSNLIGENADNKLNTIYLGKENQLFDLNYIGELKGEKSNINIEVQGALKDKATKHFKGTIDFKRGCKKSTGNENEQCMLLSDSAKSLALPILLCSEEEVEGNHSSSAGKVGEKELFYIMSRGFKLKEAMKLIVRAKFNKIIDNIQNQELKNEILQEIDKRLD